MRQPWSTAMRKTNGLIGHFFEDRRLKPTAIETRAEAHGRPAMSILNSGLRYSTN